MNTIEEIESKITGFKEQLLTATDEEVIKIQSQIDSANKELEVEKWLLQLNDEAEAHAKSLGELFNCNITPAIFIVEELKDAAVAFVREPDAKTGMKILRAYYTNEEMGLELIAKSQLIRDSDLKQRNMDGSASDSRFMDAKGDYDRKYSMLNMSLLFRMERLVKVYSDEFKKK